MQPPNPSTKIAWRRGDGVPRYGENIRLVVRHRGKTVPKHGDAAATRRGYRPSMVGRSGRLATRLTCRSRVTSHLGVGDPRAGATVLLLVSNGRLGYRVLRCLAALEKQVSAVLVLGSRNESSWSTRGLASSRYCTAWIEAKWGYRDWRTAEQINLIAADYPRLLVFAADMLTTEFLARFGEAIDCEVCPSPGARALARLARKDDFAKFCRDAAIPHPATVVARDLEAAKRLVAARPADQRLVLKPLNGQGSTGVRIIRASRPDWNAIDYAPILIQDFVPGSDLCAAAFCRDGRVMLFQAYRHVHRRVLGKGINVGIEFFEDAALHDLVGRAAKHAGLNGLVCFDARRTDTGDLVLIECNPRPWFTMHLAMLAGINFVSCAVDAARPPPFPVSTFIGVVPGGIVAPGGPPWIHARHIARDASYFLSEDLTARIKHMLGRSPDFPD